MTITGAGLVGIGTTSPNQMLTVAGTIAQTTGRIDFVGFNPGPSSVCNSSIGQYDAGYYSLTYCSSDARLKKDIKPIDNGLDAIMHIQPSNFRWKADKSERLRAGFVAQNVKPYIPEAVSIPPNAKYYEFDEKALLAYSVKAIQELKADNDNLRALVAKQGQEFEAYKARHP